MIRLFRIRSLAACRVEPFIVSSDRTAARLGRAGGLFIQHPLVGESIHEGASRIAHLRIAHRPRLNWAIFGEHLTRKNLPIFRRHRCLLGQVGRKCVSSIAAPTQRGPEITAKAEALARSGCRRCRSSHRLWPRLRLRYYRTGTAVLSTDSEGLRA
jgi:hypothetical protein